MVKTSEVLKTSAVFVIYWGFYTQRFLAKEYNPAKHL